MDRAQNEALIDKALDTLGEHFEAIQIIATDSDGGGSLYVARGRGNFYARKGAVHQWLENDRHDDAAQYVKDAIRGED